jgi:hypothetical protein
MFTPSTEYLQIWEKAERKRKSYDLITSLFTIKQKSFYISEASSRLSPLLNVRHEKERSWRINYFTKIKQQVKTELRIQ